VGSVGTLLLIRSRADMKARMGGGTGTERVVAYIGVLLMAIITGGMFITAVHPRFRDLGAIWAVSGLVFLVVVAAAVKQIQAWEDGRLASRFFDPIRSRLGRRALPTVAWLMAGALSIVALYALLVLTRVVAPASVGSILASPFLLVALFAGTALEIVLARKSDIRDQRSGLAEKGPYPADPKFAGQLAASTRLDVGERRMARILRAIAYAGLFFPLIAVLVGIRIPTVLLYVSLIPFVAWVAYSRRVIRAHLHDVPERPDDASGN
jgi:hypothetical protein